MLYLLTMAIHLSKIKHYIHISEYALENISPRSGLTF